MLLDQVVALNRAQPLINRFEHAQRVLITLIHLGDHVMLGLEGILERVHPHHHQILHSVHLIDLALHLEQVRSHLFGRLHHLLHGLADLASQHLLCLVHFQVIHSEMLSKILQ